MKALAAILFLLMAVPSHAAMGYDPSPAKQLPGDIPEAEFVRLVRDAMPLPVTRVFLGALRGEPRYMITMDAMDPKQPELTLTITILEDIRADAETYKKAITEAGFIARGFIARKYGGLTVD